MNNSIIDIELTNRLGYDGGAFFNQDASEIVWRVYHPQSQEDVINYQSLLEQSSIRRMALQIWTMQADSSNKKQVADNDSENFGPYFFPMENELFFHQICMIQKDGILIFMLSIQMAKIWSGSSILMVFPCLVLMGKILFLHPTETKRNVGKQTCLLQSGKNYETFKINIFNY